MFGNTQDGPEGSVVPMRLVLVLLVLMVALSGCLADGGPPSTADSGQLPQEQTRWTWEGNGTGAWEVALGSELDGAECEATFIASSVSEEIRHVMFTGIVGAADPEFPHVYGNHASRTGAPRVALQAAGVEAETSPMASKSEWSMTWQETFEALDGTKIYVAFTDTTFLAQERLPTPNAGNRTGGAWLTVACDRPFEEPLRREASDFLIMDERTMKGGASVHAGMESGLRLGHVAAETGPDFTVDGDLVLIGIASGDPTKAGMLTLDGPETAQRWLFLPPPSFIVGDNYVNYEGAAGQYRLRLSTVNVGPLIDVLACLMDFPVKDV